MAARARERARRKVERGRRNNNENGDSGLHGDLEPSIEKVMTVMTIRNCT